MRGLLDDGGDLSNVRGDLAGGGRLLFRSSSDLVYLHGYVANLSKDHLQSLAGLDG